MKQGRANGYVCLLCERWYSEMEDAETCERSHDLKHEKLTEDAREVACDWLEDRS